MSKAVRASDKPYPVEVHAEKTYYWCACGLSKKQPFCDGSHTSTDFQPVKYMAEKSKTIFFCGCKQTANPPFCDGSHNNK